jgi:hypothetical protein
MLPSAKKKQHYHLSSLIILLEAFEYTVIADVTSNCQRDRVIND